MSVILEKTQKSALVLFSGGQDSATCLAWALERFDRVETVVAPRDLGLLGFLFDVGFVPSPRLPFVRALG